MGRRKPKLVSNMEIAVSAQTVVSFPTGNSRIAVGLTLLAVLAFLTTCATEL
jgi:hypothetical protein